MIQQMTPGACGRVRSTQIQKQSLPGQILLTWMRTRRKCSLRRERALQTPSAYSPSPFWLSNIYSLFVFMSLGTNECTGWHALVSNLGNHSLPTHLMQHNSQLMDRGWSLRKSVVAL